MGWLFGQGPHKCGRKQDKDANVVCVACRTRQACRLGGTRWVAVSVETRPTPCSRLSKPDETPYSGAVEKQPNS